MTNPSILDVPVEQSLELVASIGSDGMDAKGELLDHLIYEIYGVLLSMAFVDLQGSYPSSIIDGGVLETPYLPTIIVLEGKKGHVNLYVMARNPFCITLGVDGRRPTFLGRRLKPWRMRVR